jgi:3-phosphoshikimate 1-carboxyvinyltransferase
MRLASAQVKSAILLAGLRADGRTTVVESYPTRDHTERMLGAFGLCVRSDGREVSVEPALPRSPGILNVPGDFSSAAFFIVAALCVPGSSLTLNELGSNPTRIGLLSVLARMGARITSKVSQDEWEPRGRLVVEASSLNATTVAPAEVATLIDELPILMVAAACAKGVSRFEGIGELRVKETDRIASMVDGLRRLGVRARAPQPDCVEIEGARLSGAEVESMNDHRTAMSLAVAGLIAQGVTTIRGIECVAKSFPGFFEQLRSVSASATVKTVDKA